MRSALIEIPVCLIILIITYWLETIEIESVVIIYIHSFFLVCGLMAVGLPPAYVIKKLESFLSKKLYDRKAANSSDET